MKTCLIYQLNDNWQLSDMHGIELTTHFKLSRYTFSKCQQADIKSRHDKLNFETTFILSNDVCIFDLKNRVHTPDYCNFRLTVTSESMCTKYWFNCLVKLPGGKSVIR